MDPFSAVSMAMPPGHGMEQYSTPAVQSVNVGNNLGEIMDYVSLGNNVSVPVVSENDSRLANIDAFGNSVADSEPTGEQRVVVKMHLRTEAVNSKLVQLQKGDIAWIKKDDADTTGPSVSSILYLSAKDADTMFMEDVQRVGVNTAQLNKHALLQQLKLLAGRTEGWSAMAPGEEYVGQKQLKSAYHVFEGLDYIYGGLLHSDTTEAGFANHAYEGGMIGSNNQVDNNYIVDLELQGHGYIRNMFAPVISAGMGLFFVFQLTPVYWQELVPIDAVSVDRNIMSTEFDDIGRYIPGAGRDRARYYDSSKSAEDPYPVPKTAGTIDENYYRAQMTEPKNQLIPPKIWVYQMVPYASTSAVRTVPYEEFIDDSQPTMVSPNRKPDAIVFRIARMRHGYAFNDVVFDDKDFFHSGETGDTRRLRAHRGANYDIQCACPQMECIMTPITQPTYYGQSPEMHDP